MPTRQNDLYGPRIGGGSNTLGFQPKTGYFYISDFEEHPNTSNE
jgi:hypothetical protein